MTFRRAALACLLAVLWLVGSTAATQQMGIDEIRPGMVGTGHTVFDGTRVEEFKVNILGVLENVIGTHRNLILARLEGGPLANTGVIAGMSGSPVFIDGRLIGAVSYSLGAFSKEPIAGITPIAEMTDAASFNSVRAPGTKVQVEFPLTQESLATALRTAFARNRPFAASPQDVLPSGFSSVAGLSGGQVGALLKPIATPLVMSGFDPEVSSLLAGAFGSEGFVPTGGSTAGFHSGEMPFEGPLKAGDAVGVMLVNGDLQLGATGTVTHIDNDRVYAFGHPFYNLGPTEFPMTRAYVYTVLPSLSSSFKLSSTGEVIGTFQQDRSTAISGTLGPGPKMIPITLALKSESGESRTFRFDIVNDQLLTPLAAYVSVLNTLGSYQRQAGAATFTVQGKAALKNHDSISFDNVFSGDTAAAGTAGYFIAPLSYLMGNDREKIEIEGLDLTVSAVEMPRTATIERVWLDDPRPRAGRTVPVKILLRTYRGDDLIRTVPIEIPPNATGSLSLLVSDGARLGQAELRETRATQQPRTIDQVIRSLNKARRNSTVYVKLLGNNEGAVVNGELLSSLPPSVLGVLEADRNGGSFNPIRSATLGEWELTTEHAVSGSRTLSFSVAGN